MKHVVKIVPERIDVPGSAVAQTDDDGIVLFSLEKISLKSDPAFPNFHSVQLKLESIVQLPPVFYDELMALIERYVRQIKFPPPPEANALVNTIKVRLKMKPIQQKSINRWRATIEGSPREVTSQYVEFHVMDVKDLDKKFEFSEIEELEINYKRY